MPATLDPKAYILGAADIFYRAVGVNTPWTSVGATLDDAILHVTTERFVPDNINGVMGPVMGLDYQRRQNGTLEFTMPEIAGSKLALALPGARVAAPTNTSAAGGSTTLSATTAVGATSIDVASATSFAVGDYIKIDTSTSAEYRQITAIASTTFSFRDPLLRAHTSGVAAVEWTDDNKTLITSSITRRMPDSEYREWCAVASNGDGYQEIRFPRGIAMVDSADVTFGEQTVAGIRVTIGGRYLGSSLQTSPFTIYAPGTPA
jgi:hypothetical protein